jgi:2-methylisocitrate lyase-like PEP mutase family enzyme
VLYAPARNGQNIPPAFKLEKSKFWQSQGSAMTSTQKAGRLLELHRAEDPLVLVNAWDAASARMVERAGFPAVASSSAGVAFALGCSDGQKLPWREMVAAIKRIADAVQVPVSADIEAGFSADLSQLEGAIEEVIGAGAVGVNLEDAIPHQGEQGLLYPMTEQTARIQAARRIGEKLGVHLVINARTDAWLQQGVNREQAFHDALERGKAYLQAGADCIFVLGLRDAQSIRATLEELRAPINILATTGGLSIPELKKLGVKRISMGSGPMRAAMGLLRRIAEEAKSFGTYKAMIEGAVPYPEMNGMFD